MQDSSTATNPMTITTKLDKDIGASMDITSYRCMIGSIFYLTTSRPYFTMPPVYVQDSKLIQGNLI